MGKLDRNPPLDLLGLKIIHCRPCCLHWHSTVRKINEIHGARVSTTFTRIHREICQRARTRSWFSKVRVLKKMLVELKVSGYGMGMTNPSPDLLQILISSYSPVKFRAQSCFGVGTILLLLLFVRFGRLVPTEVVVTVPRRHGLSRWA